MEEANEGMALPTEEELTQFQAQAGQEESDG